MAYNPTSLEFKQLSKEYNLIPIYKEIRADLDTPLSIYLKLAKNSYSFLLESITGGENLARYSIIGINPRKIIKTGKNDIVMITDVEGLKLHIKKIDNTNINTTGD